MKREIRFKRIHWLEIDGTKKRFMSGDLAEVEEVEGKKLIESGVALPGRQAGASMCILGNEPA